MEQNEEMVVGVYLFFFFSYKGAGSEALPRKKKRLKADVSVKV